MQPRGKAAEHVLEKQSQLQYQPAVPLLGSQPRKMVARMKQAGITQSTPTAETSNHPLRQTDHTLHLQNDKHQDVSPVEKGHHKGRCSMASVKLKQNIKNMRLAIA